VTEGIDIPVSLPVILIAYLLVGVFLKHARTGRQSMRSAEPAGRACERHQRRSYAGDCVWSCVACWRDFWACCWLGAQPASERRPWARNSTLFRGIIGARASSAGTYGAGRIAARW